MLILYAATSVSSPRRLPMRPLIKVLVREVSLLRRGLTGGKGGGEPEMAALPLLDLALRPSCRISVVGTLEVDITNVGSEISFLLMDRFIASVRVLPLMFAYGFDGTEGRLERGSAGVEVPDPGADPGALLDG